MKKIIIILFIILIMPFNVQAFAESNTENINNKADNQQVEDLYDYISKMKTQNELLKDMDVKTYVQQFMKTGDGKFTFTKVGKAIATYAFKEIQASYKLLVMVVMIALICSLLNNLQKAFSNEGLSNIAYFACYSLIIVLLAKSFYIGVDTAKGAIKGMSDFMTALIPVLIGLLAAVGGFVEASIMNPLVLGAVDISARIFSEFLIPLICLTFVLQFVNNLSKDYKIDKLAKLFNQIALWIQGIVITVFIGIITVRGITSTTIDQVTAKTAKFAVDNFVPFVGKSLSDAISTVAGYSLLLKNALSSLGLVIIIFIMLMPVIKILVMALLFKLTAALIEPISDDRMVNCISSAGDSMMLILSCVISVSVMFFIMISIIAAAGKISIGM